ncbi:hypothetical protein M2323_000981 [Rhodoblastus acidophilus]|nr:hypothetical protein [Rhodoblastus acidophilus]MCW2332072.1 hypothetical protein [Rhodoblastus acidophilus]
MFAVHPVDPEAERPLLRAVGENANFHFCANAAQGVCNWLVPAESDQTLCRSCRHNHLAPDLSIAGNLMRWQRVEQAKQHLFYSLIRWRLPTPTQAEGVAEPLVFDLVGDVQTSEGVTRIYTGHDSGLITINIAEADDDERERRRLGLGEPYRTLLGHFRHEIGHYYWDILVRDGKMLDEFRNLFGDERLDYGAALQRYHAEGAAPDWPGAFISAYATAHPWEDFAESFAHHIHIVDTLETAHALGLSIDARAVRDESLKTDVAFDAYHADTFDAVIAAWTPVSVALNSLTRSLGQQDAYPFVLSQTIVAKLDFIHRLIRAQQADTAPVSA